MQLFVRVANRNSIVVEVDSQSTTVADLRQIVASKCQFRQSGFSPRIQFTHNGTYLTDWQKTLAHYDIRKDALIQITPRIHQQIYVEWNGKWLSRKDCPSVHENFWSLLCKDNLVQSDWYENSPMVETIRNLTVWHLKKVVAEFLLLDPSEIDLRFYGGSKPDSDPLANDFALDEDWRSCGRDFCATLNVPRRASRKRGRETSKLSFFK